MRLWHRLRQHPGRNGYLLLAGGAVSALVGVVGTLTFLHEIQIGGRIPAGQIAARLILPHVILLLGLGMLLTGFILLRRDAVIRNRTEPED